MEFVNIIQYKCSMAKGIKKIVTSHTDEVDVDMNDQLDDMICIIGEYFFRKSKVYDT